VGKNCPFCSKEIKTSAAKSSIQKINWSKNSDLYQDLNDFKHQNIEVHGIYVEGDMKTIHGDEIHEGGTKTEIKDSILNRTNLNINNQMDFNKCVKCKYRIEDDWKSCPKCGHTICKK